MAGLKLKFLILALYILFENINCDQDSNENRNNVYRPQVWNLLNYLNLNPNRVYNYKYATLNNAQNKDANSVQLSINVEVDCRQPDSNLCVTNLFECEGIINYNANEQTYETQPGVVCIPKTRTELPNNEKTVGERSEILWDAALSHEVNKDGNVSGEQFVAVRKDSAYCTGCIIDLNTDVAGLEELTNTALKHLESERSNKQALVRVIRVQRQIVSGVKYILLLEISPTVCSKNVDQTNLATCVIDTNAPSEICEITYLQQVWINKAKRIISNNCTVSQEFTIQTVTEQTRTTRAPNDLDNEIDVNYNSDETPSKPVDEKVDNGPNYDCIADKGHADDILTITNGDDIMDPVRMAEMESQIIVTNPEEPVREVTTEDAVFLSEQKTFLDHFLEVMEEQFRNRRAVNENDDTDTSSSSSSSEQRRENKNKEKKTNELINKDKDKDSSSSSSSSSEDNDLKRAKRELSASQDSVESTVDNEENNNQDLIRVRRAGIPGGVNTVDVNDPAIQKYSKDLLKELDAQDGSGKTHELVQVISATRQVVSGSLYKLKLVITENGQNITCDYEVWDQPWLPKGKKVTAKCGEVQSKEYRYKRSLLGQDDHDIHLGLFKDFIQTFNKNYADKLEFRRRFQIFRKNMKTIKMLNDNEQGTAKYGPTMFADLSTNEFRRYLGLKPSLQNPNNVPLTKAVTPDVELPTEFDWRTKGVISEVKDQGQCGSCWAFSVTGNIEGINAIKTGNLIELSEQELVDCDKLDDGCGGGLPDNAYRAIEQLGGLETETDYPYEAENEKCHFNKSLTKVQISGAVNISSDETDMAKWLTANGPMSIGINANAMQFYMGGVSHPWKFLCDPESLDHGVLIVGYGVHTYPLFKKTLPYWTIKNSWGHRWGEQGYYRVYRGDGTCGVNKMVSSAVL